MKALMMYRSKTVENLKQFWGRYCKKCNEVKPMRTHHCSVCNRCVFQMDHHCPWVNNCLGLENKRYFLLFIFYMFLGSTWYMLSIMAIWHTHVYQEHRKDLRFLYILNSALLTALGLFNVFSWYLAVNGTMTIEFWQKATGKKEGEPEPSQEIHPENYGFNSIKDNLFMLFGTYKYMRILSPSLRNVPLTGLEWSFLTWNQGYNEFGYRPNPLY